MKRITWWGKKYQFVWREKLTFCAGYAIWISSITRLTSTYSSVVSGLAIGMPCALAGVNTLFILTFQCCWAIRVRDTLRSSAEFIGIAPVVRRTNARCPMILNNTLGICSTALIDAWILTFSIDACLSERAFTVTLTTSWKIKQNFMHFCTCF